MLRPGIAWGLVLARTQRRLALLLGALLLPVLLTGCPPGLSGQKELSPDEVKWFIKGGGDPRSIRVWRGLVDMGSLSQQSYRVPATGSATPISEETFTASIQLVPPNGLVGKKQFAGFASSAARGTMQLRLSTASDDLTESGYLIATFRARAAGSVCLRLSGKATLQDQRFQGTFSVLGGTGLGARLRATGSIRATQPKAFSVKWQFAALTTPSLAASRPIPAACANAGKPTPKPPPAKATATLDGFAFASALATALPAGAQVFPEGSTVSGTDGCGGDNNLFAVVTYSGPSATIEGAVFKPNGTVTVKHPVHSGQNVIFLLASPPNGSYSMKLYFPGVDGPVFAPSLTLNRTC
jgi:hypothetical protein